MRRTLYLLLFSLATPQLLADELQPYAHLHSISFSSPVAIDAITDDWDAPFRKGDTALTYNKAEVGVRWRTWQLGIINKYDYFLDFDPETAELFYLTENHLPLTPGNEYSLKINAQHIHSRGLRLAYQSTIIPGLKMGVATSYLKGTTLLDGRIHGLAQVTATQDYDFQFNTDYYYSEDVLFEREVDSPTGHGYSLDLSLLWSPQWNSKHQLTTKLEIIDLFGKMYWQDTPHTVATASSDTKTYDEDGYVRYKPAISGLESNRDFVQRIPRKVFFEANYTWTPKLSLVGQIQDFEIQRFTQLGVYWNFQQKHQLKTLFNIQAKALTLGYQHEQFLIELGSDAFKFHRARYLSLNLVFNTYF